MVVVCCDHRGRRYVRRDSRMMIDVKDTMKLQLDLCAVIEKLSSFATHHNITAYLPLE